MKSVVILVLLLLVIKIKVIQSQDGFATLGEGTRGGAGGSIVTVCTEDELLAAVEDDIPRIVRVICHIQPSRRVKVGSNKSILGGSTEALISEHGFIIEQKRNVIIRGLRFCCAVAPDDGVTIDGSTNVWIDHNEFYSDMEHDKDYYDGLLDIIRGSDFITVSWNEFHDHWKTILIGHNDNYGHTDIGKFHITIHHNYFYRCNSRLPSLRFGTGHIYSNFYDNVISNAINSRMGAEVLVEGNVFRNSDQALTTSQDSIEDGYAVERNNDFGGALSIITQNGTFVNPPYSYRLDLLSKIPYLVQQRAGAKLLF